MAICSRSGEGSRLPATASTNDGAMEEENCRLGRKRHNPVSSIHVRASSRESVPGPFRRILSARDASNCSDVKEKPRFQAGVNAGLPRLLREGLPPCTCFKSDGRPAGSPSKNTAKRLDVHAGNWLGGSFSLTPIITTLYGPGQVGC